MLIIIQFIIGLLFAFNVVNRSNDFLAGFYMAINRLLEPVLGPIRNVCRKRARSISRRWC